MEIEEQVMAKYSKIQPASVGSTAPGIVRYHDFSSESGDNPNQLVTARKTPLIRVAPNTTSQNRERSGYMYDNIFQMGVTNGVYTDVVRFTCLDSRDDAVPSSNELWTRVLWRCSAAGHSSAVGSGSIYRVGNIDYAGASPTNTTNIVNGADGNSPQLRWTHSNFVSTFAVAGSGTASGGLNTLVHLQIYFCRGAGSAGAHIYFDLEELI